MLNKILISFLATFYAISIVFQSLPCSQEQGITEGAFTFMKNGHGKTKS
jgi:hypothetical protein